MDEERQEWDGVPKRDLIDEVYDNWGGGLVVLIVIATVVLFGLACYGCFALLGVG